MVVIALDTVRDGCPSALSSEPPVASLTSLSLPAAAARRPVSMGLRFAARAHGIRGGVVLLRSSPERHSYRQSPALPLDRDQPRKSSVCVRCSWAPRRRPRGLQPRQVPRHKPIRASRTQDESGSTGGEPHSRIGSVVGRLWAARRRAAPMTGLCARASGSGRAPTGERSEWAASEPRPGAGPRPRGRVRHASATAAAGASSLPSYRVGRRRPRPGARVRERHVVPAQSARLCARAWTERPTWCRAGSPTVRSTRRFISDSTDSWVGPDRRPPTSRTNGNSARRSLVGVFWPRPPSAAAGPPRSGRPRPSSAVTGLFPFSSPAVLGEQSHLRRSRRDCLRGTFRSCVRKCDTYEQTGRRQRPVDHKRRPRRDIGPQHRK